MQNKRRLTKQSLLIGQQQSFGFSDFAIEQIRYYLWYLNDKLRELHSLDT